VRKKTLNFESRAREMPARQEVGTARELIKKILPRLKDRK